MLSYHLNDNMIGIQNVIDLEDFLDRNDIRQLGLPSGEIIDDIIAEKVGFFNIYFNGMYQRINSKKSTNILEPAFMLSSFSLYIISKQKATIFDLNHISIQYFDAGLCF